MSAIRLLSFALVLALAACKPTEPESAPAPTVQAPQPTTTTPAAKPSAEDARTTHWLCGDLHVVARFNENLDAINLQLPDRRIELIEANAQTGARFTDSNGNEFWSRGKQVTLTLAGKSPEACKKLRPAQKS